MKAARYAGTSLVVRSYVRSGWPGLAFWTLAMSAAVVATGWSIVALYPTDASRSAYARSAGASPAVAAFNGRAYDVTELGAIVSYEVGFMALVGFPVIAIHLAIRYSRHEEDSGRMELMTAGRVGTLAPLTAAALVLGLCLTSFAVVAALGLISAGLPTGGSWLYCISLALLAGSFGALGLLISQSTRESRPAYAIGLGISLGAFLVRAVVDGQGRDMGWLSPSGWLAEVRPWAAWQWWPFVAYLGLAVTCLVPAAVLAARRDLYGGLLAPRPGPANAPDHLGTPIGFAWRFTRAPVSGWLLGTIAWNAAFGVLAVEMTEIANANPTMLEALGVERAETLVTSLALLLSGVGASAFGVQAIARLANEETAGRLGYVLSTGADRVGLWLAWLGVVMAAAGATLLASSLSLGLSAAWSTGDGSIIGNSLWAATVLLPASLCTISIAAALHALNTRLTSLAWAVVGWSVVVGLLAETLRLPEAARDLSPLHAVGKVPVDDPSYPALVLVTLMTALLVIAGARRVGRRDLVAG